MTDKCNVPPEGWYCTRAPGHDGPCAALPTEDNDIGQAELQSFMPPFEEVKNEVMMSMQIVSLRTSKDSGVTNDAVMTTMEWENTNGETAPVHGILTKIDRDDVRGYLPSRIWYNNTKAAFNLSFYTNSTLPDGVKPFRNGPTYVLVVSMRDANVWPKLNYPADWTVFIEHVVTPDSVNGVTYVFVFGENLYDEIIARKV